MQAASLTSFICLILIMSVSLLFLDAKNDIAGETITEFEKPPYVDIKQLYRISTDKELGSGIPFYHYG